MLQDFDDLSPIQERGRKQGIYIAIALLLIGIVIGSSMAYSWIQLARKRLEMKSQAEKLLPLLEDFREKNGDWPKSYEPVKESIKLSLPELFTLIENGQFQINFETLHLVDSKTHSNEENSLKPQSFIAYETEATSRGGLVILSDGTVRFVDADAFKR